MVKIGTFSFKEVNMENEKVKKIHYELETFDFYSINPLEFSLLTDIDKKLLNKLLNKKENRKLYTFIIEEYYKPEKKGMFESLRAPNEFPDEEFEFVVDFEKQISEHEFTEDDVSNPYYTYLGIAEIDVDFYVANYDFFNSIQRQYLIICDESKIKDIDKKLCNSLNQILNNASSLVEKMHLELKVDDFISALDEDNCILLRALDTGEFKNMVFLVNDEEDEKEITKYFNELHDDFIVLRDMSKVANTNIF